MLTLKIKGKKYNLFPDAKREVELRERLIKTYNQGEPVIIFEGKTEMDRCTLGDIFSEN